MQVTRSQLVVLFMALGYATAEQWNPERMRKNIAKLGDKDEDAVLDKLKEDKALSKEDRDALGELALELMAATAAKEEVEVLATADDADDETVETEVAEGDGDKAEEGAEKATAKPKREKKEKQATAKTAKPAKKKDSANGQRGLGIIATIASLVKKASKEKPISKESILAALVKAFPDRDLEGMKKTIAVQLPNRMANEKGMDIQKNEHGFWVGG